MPEILAIAGLFLVRVGIPLMVLIVLGLLIDRWQTRRNQEIAKALEKRTLDFAAYKEKAQKAESEDDRRKAA